MPTLPEAPKKASALKCGLTPHTGADVIGWPSEILRDREQVRADVPPHTDPASQAAYLESLRELVAAALEEPGLLERFAAARDAEDLGRLRPALPHLTGIPADPDLRVRVWVWVRVTTGRARMTVAGDGEEGVVSRFTAAGHEGLPRHARRPRRHLDPGPWLGPGHGPERLHLLRRRPSPGRRTDHPPDHRGSDRRIN